jgi:dolichol-phosphate mannosyltransferase
MDISIVLPAYKEAENLKNILPLINQTLGKANIDYEILVINTIIQMDDTESVCNKNQAICISREGGNLYGDAIRTGLKKARGKYIVVMDADGSHNPSDILRFYSEMKQKDYTLIIGSRYCKGGYTDNNFILKFMSWILNVSYRIMFGLKVKDVSDSFRMYNADSIKKVELECDNFDIVEEILIKLKYGVSNFNVKEIPISFNKRVAGESKRDLLKFIKSYIQTMRKLLHIKNQTKSKKK